MSRGGRQNAAAPWTAAWSGYFADPFVWRADGAYFAVGTGASEARGRAQASVFPLLRSADLSEWTQVGFAMERLAPALGDAYWAPEVARGPDARWYLYYSVGFGDRRHHLRVACADEPQGPYSDVGALTSPDELPFAIDPHPFLDHDGRWYLFHARDFLDAPDAGGGGVRAGTALVVTPMASMVSLTDDTYLVARARHDWQRFARDRPMYGQRYDWHTLEGPCVVPHAGRYYCLYSAGRWEDGTYGVDYVESSSVLGPWEDTGVEHGPRVLRTLPGMLTGPGHCSVVRSVDGVGYRIAFHAWDRDRTTRQLYLGELNFTDYGPRVAGIS